MKIYFAHYKGMLPGGMLGCLEGIFVCYLHTTLLAVTPASLCSNSV